MNTHKFEPHQHAGEPLAVSIPEAVRLSGIGRTKLYEAIASGDLPSFKAGRRRLIPTQGLRAYLAGLMSATLAPEGANER